MTIVVIVARVAIPNMAVTHATPDMSPLAAGNITMGMSASHGPKRKIVNKTHGVIDSTVFSDGSCRLPIV
jgi:hypothetical protein